MNGYPFKAGQTVSIQDAKGTWDTSGTIKEVVNADYLSLTVGFVGDTLYLVETGAYQARHTFICKACDMRVVGPYCYAPEEAPHFLNWKEEAELTEKATALFKALNDRNIGGRHHMGSKTGFDTLRAAAAKKGKTLVGFAWTEQRKVRRGYPESLMARGETVYVSDAKAYDENYTREQAEAERAATKQAVIEEATKVGLYVTDSGYINAVYISPRYQHSAVNAAEVYAAWSAAQTAEQDAQ